MPKLNLIVNSFTRSKRLMAGGIFISLFFIVYTLYFIPKAEAAVLSISPSSGTFEVGSIFDVNVVLNTEGETINTISVMLRFPVDSLQIVSPTSGKSIIGIWTRVPKYDNARGLVDLQGVIPGGINTSRGLITTMSFRVKKPGKAFVRFLDDSAVLLHDGKGTDALGRRQDAVYNLMLPPPAGPIVASETHPDQTKWYSTASASFTWVNDELVGGFSYVLDEEPVTIPDDIMQGTKSNVVYRNLSDRNYYFHIKAFREGKWGGTTHFAINVDTQPPVEFPVEIAPAAKTSSRNPVIYFTTTDKFSGISRYELKIIPLKLKEESSEGFQEFFIEVTSPYSPVNLALGDYDIIVRAYDNAENLLEVTQKLEIRTPIFKIISSKGIEIRGTILIPWYVIFILLFVLLMVLGLITWLVYRQHNILENQLNSQELPGVVENQLFELQKYREKYGKMLTILLLIFSVFFVAGSAFAENNNSSEQIMISPPIITIASKNITNEEIFYLGGQLETAGMEVVIFVQNLTSGETFSRTIKGDSRGQWFYRHDALMPSGRYILWAQSRLGEQISPPSPQIQITVTTTALQLGSTRISYAILFFALALIMILANLMLVVFILHHRKHIKAKHARIQKEIQEAEESIRRGFAILRKDIKAELDIIEKVKIGKELSEELIMRENELLRDLEEIEHKVGEEIWDIEKAEYE